MSHSGRHKGGKPGQSPYERLAQRRREFEAIDSDKQRSRRRPGSMSGRK